MSNAVGFVSGATSAPLSMLFGAAMWDVLCHRKDKTTNWTAFAIKAVTTATLLSYALSTSSSSFAIGFKTAAVAGSALAGVIPSLMSYTGDQQLRNKTTDPESDAKAALLSLALSAGAGSIIGGVGALSTNPTTGCILASMTAKACSQIAINTLR